MPGAPRGTSMACTTVSPFTKRMVLVPYGKGAQPLKDSLAPRIGMSLQLERSARGQRREQPSPLPLQLYPEPADHLAVATRTAIQAARTKPEGVVGVEPAGHLTT